MLVFVRSMIIIVALFIVTLLVFSSTEDKKVQDILGKIYAAQIECKTDKGFYSEYPEAGQGLVKKAMNNSHFDFKIEITDNGFTAYAGKKITIRNLDNDSVEFIQLYSIDQDSILKVISN